MNNTEITNETYTCHKCGMTTNDRRIVVFTHPLMPPQCYSNGACDRRMKRNAIIAEMQEMAKKPHVHPVDKFSRAAVAICAFFMGCIITVGLTYLWFGV